MRPIVTAGIALCLAMTSTGKAQSPSPLVQPGGLVWEGAFRLPAGPIGSSSFGYSGLALAYHAGNDSLYVVGHDYQLHVAEIDIPQAVKGTSLNALPTATVRQSFADVTEGRMSRIGGYPVYRFGGMLVFGGRLISSVYSYYDATHGATASHFTHSLTVAATGTATGPHRVGTLNPGFYAGGMAVVPAAWRSLLGGPAITGQCCIGIIGRSSYGPSAFAFDPSQLGSASSVAAQPLVYYPESNPLTRWEESNTTLFNGSTQMAGSLILEGARSLLFIGRHGTGRFCYGSTCEASGPDPYCGGQIQAPPYQVQVWAYDLNDLAAVRGGQRQPWDVRPYAVWPLTGNVHPSPLPFFHRCMSVRGLAHDPATNRVWVVAEGADGDNPVIHLFRPGSGSVAPSVPTNFRVIR